MTACAEAFVPGSCVVLTHTTADVVPYEAGRELREAAALYSRLVAPFQGGEGEGPQSESRARIWCHRQPVTVVTGVIANVTARLSNAA
jgi:hypothetical protein